MDILVRKGTPNARHQKALFFDSDKCVVLALSSRGETGADGAAMHLIS